MCCAALCCHSRAVQIHVVSVAKSCSSLLNLLQLVPSYGEFSTNHLWYSPVEGIDPSCLCFFLLQLGMKNTVNDHSVFTDVHNFLASLAIPKIMYLCCSEVGCHNRVPDFDLSNILKTCKLFSICRCMNSMTLIFSQNS